MDNLNDLNLLSLQHSSNSSFVTNRVPYFTLLALCETPIDVGISLIFPLVISVIYLLRPLLEGVVGGFVKISIPGVKMVFQL